MLPPAEQRPPRARRRKPHPNVYRAATNLEPYPYFSQEDCECRWGTVRREMEGAGLECLIVPPGGDATSELSAAARYLSHVGTAGVDVSVVFPLASEPAAITADAPLWSASQPWCVDLRRSEPSHGAAMLVKLREMGLRRGRVGLVGLGTDGSGGTIPAAFLRTLQEGLPRVTWVDFTAQIQRIRAVKSVEELAFLRQSARIVDRAYDALYEALEAGQSELALCANVAETLCTLGSELPIHIDWTPDFEPQRVTGEPIGSELMAGSPPPLRGRIREGGILRSEIAAAWGGYRVHGLRPIAAGRPDPAAAQLFDIAAGIWNELYASMRPGVGLKQLQTRGEALRARFPFSTDLRDSVTVRVVIRGCGLGSDLPSMIPGADGDGPDGEHRLRVGECFTLSSVVQAGGRSMAWGEAIVVTSRGAERVAGSSPRLRVAGV